MHSFFKEASQDTSDNIIKKLDTQLNEVDEKIAFIIEATRSIDQWMLLRRHKVNKEYYNDIDYSILRWGYISVLENLLQRRPAQYFPMKESTPEAHNFSIQVLYKLGVARLLSKTADLIELGYMSATWIENECTVKSMPFTRDQNLDILDKLNHEKLTHQLKLENKAPNNKWGRRDLSENEAIPNDIGAFSGLRVNKLLNKAKLGNIIEKMEELVSPWDSGRGIMIQYGATQEVDNHFYSIALETAIEWRNETGLHPEAKFNDVTGSELTIIIAIITSITLKHIAFLEIALKKNSHISIGQTLAHHEVKSELINAIHDSQIAIAANFSKEKIEALINTITIKPTDVDSFKNENDLLFPIFIEIGENLLLRPSHSAMGNPFPTIIKIHEKKNNRLENELNKHKEEMFRNEIYGLFQGNRYICLDGNIALKGNSGTMTDLDAVIFDRTSGSLGIFQIKWQNFNTTNVRKLKSRTSNLSKSLDEWTSSVLNWIEANEHHKLLKTLRLKSDIKINKIYLFGLSRSISRTRSYGSPQRNHKIATANWHEFYNTRTNIGPSKNTLGDIHTRIQQNHNDNKKWKLNGIEKTFKYKSHTIKYIDYWHALEARETKSPIQVKLDWISIAPFTEYSQIQQEDSRNDATHQ